MRMRENEKLRFWHCDASSVREEADQQPTSIDLFMPECLWQAQLPSHMVQPIDA